MSTGAGLTARVAVRVARAELRRHRAAFGALLVVIALVSATVVAGLLAARRSSTAIERFDTWAGASDVLFQSDSLEASDQLVTVVAAQPQTVAMASYRLVNAFPTDAAVPDLALRTDVDGAYGETIDRPRVLEGRLPAADAPGEVMLNELASKVTGLGLGDHLQVSTWSLDDLDQLGNGPFPGFNGPQLDLTVVGIGRTTEELSGDVRRTAPYALTSPALLTAHPDLGAWPPAVVARLAHGSSDVRAVGNAVSGIRPGSDSSGGSDGPGGAYSLGTTADDTYRLAAQRSVNALAIGLLLFALAAAVAGTTVIVGAVARQLGADTNVQLSLRASGLGPRAVAVALAGAPVVVCLVGTLLGAAGAVFVAPHLLFGLARRVEPDGGLWWDPVTLCVAAAVIGAVLVATCWLAARRRTAGRMGSAVHADALGGRAGRPSHVRPIGAPTVAAGLALTGSREQRWTAGRAAVTGLVLGIAGVAAAGVVVHSLSVLQSQPARWGWGWSSMPDFFGDDDGSLADRVAADPRIAGSGRLVELSMQLDGEPLGGNALADVHGPVSFTVLSGRLPTTTDEVALGALTMRNLGVHLGDQVSALEADLTSTTPLTVVGTVVLPSVSDGVYNLGAVITADNVDALALGGDATDGIVLRYPPGVDAVALEHQLAQDYGLSFGLFTQAHPPGAVSALTDIRGIVMALAAFFAALGAAALLHALLVASRRSATLSILRMLGFVRRQVFGAVTVLSLRLLAAGLLIGLPLGLVVGRLSWWMMVAHLDVIATPQTPWTAIVLVPVIGCGVALLAATWPGLVASRADLGRRLQPE